jgi:hypothetical protein
MTSTLTKKTTGFGFRVDGELKRQVKHKLIDEGLSLSAWIEQCMRELVAKSEEKSRVHIALDDFAEK